jgi:hypothetical protein
MLRASVSKASVRVMTDPEIDSQHHPDVEQVRSLRDRARSAGRGAGATARKSGDALVSAVGALADEAINRVLLGDERVTSAAEGKRLLAGRADTEALAEHIQRVVVLAVPVVRMLARGARFTRVPWAMVASSAVSIGVAVRTGARELQVISALVAHRLEQSGGRADPTLVKKLAIDLYLNPKRTPDPVDGRLRLVRLTRKWVLSGALGRKTSKRAARALDAAEKLDTNGLSARWTSTKRSEAPPVVEHGRSSPESVDP